MKYVGMELLLLLVTHGILFVGGIVVGVHNSKSSTIKPLAEKVQKIGKKVAASAKKRLP